ncbi:restriction endonuclease [Macrococcoides canis]|uniref:restriction endonuclease n=1 Tax=Macrococcoides canis TaxID=1855823 RepID=UPI0022B933C1|nr:restriction endonuclease [Macrococcus canis]WBF54017.1 restriction endonuclease [Macrococcus canis]
MIETIIFSGFLIGCIYFIIKKTRYKKANKRLASSRLSAIDYMTGKEFENYLRSLFYEMGYRSIVTKSSNDFGADLVLKSEKDIIVIQAKRYKGKVGIKAVQEVYSAKGYYKADEAYVFTNSYFTSSARKLADALGVNLCDRNKLKEIKKLIE